MQSIHQELQDFIVENQKQWFKQNRRTRQINLQMEVLITTLKSFMANQAANKEEGIISSPNRMIPNYRGCNYGEVMGNHNFHKIVCNVALLKAELPTFYGDNPRSWMRKCKKFFMMHFTQVHQWMKITFLYLEGKVKLWYEGFLLDGDDLVNREEFIRAICMSFDLEIIWWKNSTSLCKIMEYTSMFKRFEKLKSLMNALNPSLSMSYYICSFISGLKDDTNPILKIFKPTTLMQAFDKVKW